MQNYNDIQKELEEIEEELKNQLSLASDLNQDTISDNNDIIANTDLNSEYEKIVHDLDEDLNNLIKKHI